MSLASRWTKLMQFTEIMIYPIILMLKVAYRKIMLSKSYN